LVDLVVAGIVIVIVGFVILFLAVIQAGRSRSDDESQRKTEVKGGGVVLIGPIPIVFGSDAKWASVAIILAIILVLISLLVMFYGGR
jgi:uncharacterized protein (TIGR00304 family)